MTTSFQLLTSENIQNIQYIPQFLNGTNVNELNNSLNIFEALCNLIPQQQDKNVKNILENTAIQTLGKMISIPETNWGKKDGAGNTILEWGIWSGSSEIMNVFHKNPYTTTKFIAIEKAQMQNFTRVLKSNHLASTFQNEQIEKFKQIGLDINIPDTRTPFELLNTGRIQDIMSVPTALNKDNVNNVNNNLNIFETLCNLIPQQQDQNVKNALENTAVQILSKMISLPETNWGKKDGAGNTILEWGIWSNSSKVMDVFHNNSQIMDKFVAAEKAQIHNFFRIAMEPHISDDFRKDQTEKLKSLGLDINDLGQDNHTALYSAINIYVNTYLNKYQLITNNPSNQNISLFQTQMDKYYKIVENLLKFGANPSLEANNILNLLANGTLQIQNTISKIPDNGHKYLAQAGFKTLIKNVKELAEKTLENCNLENSTGGNNMIATLGNIVWSIKQDISKASGQEKTLLINNFKELKSLAEPIIEKIVKQQGFNPNITDQLNSNTIAWLGELGAEFLEKCINNMYTTPDVNFSDKSGRTPLDWYSDYNATKIVETLIKTGGNVNSQCTQDAATPSHRLFLNNSKVNADKPKLQTLEVLLNKENKPPFDPSIKMVGNKTAADILEAKKTAIADYDACHNALDEYTTWYNNDYTVASLGQQVEEFNLYE